MTGSSHNDNLLDKKGSEQDTLLDKYHRLSKSYEQLVKRYNVLFQAVDIIADQNLRGQAAQRVAQDAFDAVNKLDPTFVQSELEVTRERLEEGRY
jgi:3-methyladenine DNA glycosylase/8-oxoguanine DNA glycosylase